MMIVLGAILALAGATPQVVAPDAAPWQADRPARPASAGEVEKRSVYVTMPDGIRLAADYYLPRDLEAGKQLPVILQQTRYYRSLAARSDPTGSCRQIAPFPAYFVRRGYAVVVVDVRGTGASYGSRPTEFGMQEVKDGNAVLDWVVAQPWSNGRVGAAGVSYVGTTSELLLLNRHPAVKAVAPISAGYDFYADLDFPGGVRNSFFIQNWGAFNAALDSGNMEGIPALANVAGPCPVDADPKGEMVAEAIRDHAENRNSAEGLSDVEFRDDPVFGSDGWPSPYRYQRELDRDRMPLLGIASWYDSGYARSAIHRFLNSASGKQRLLISSGNHGLGHYYAPGVTVPVPSKFDLKAELIAFFDRYVAGVDNGYDREPRVRWFTTGANRWNAANTWLRSGKRVRYCLTLAGELKAQACGKAQTLSVVPENDAAPGSLSRWDTTMSSPVAYQERSGVDSGLVNFTTEPLASDLEITGSPVFTLEITNTVSNADYFVYLEEVDSEGRAWYLTEGLVRASHHLSGKLPYQTLAAQQTNLRRDANPHTAGREITLDISMMPISHRFRQGSRIRIVLAGSDRAHFASPPLAGQKWDIAVGAHRSSLVLPVTDRKLK
ncbi:CocE/NonD family hydrolase [Sphingosinicella xenopeptidilytica]|uniref:CocE/NonD family hydrolase n=1 Tax=Sphingosinicella xenopeptidilytica TaxID=364098 RepID=A0ABW3C046_SPHXN